MIETPCRCVIETVGATLGAIDEIDVSFAQDYPPVQMDAVSADDLGLHDKLEEYLSRRYPDGLFQHQHRHIELSLSGKHAIATTRTSSGKTLSFHVVTMNAFLENPNMA